jgi:hypothetical protein
VSILKNKLQRAVYTVHKHEGERVDCKDEFLSYLTDFQKTPKEKNVQ